MEVGGQHQTPAALPLGKTRYPLYRRLEGLQGRSGQLWKISPPLGFYPRTVQTVASRYTDPLHVCVCHIYMFTANSVVYPDVKGWPCFVRSA